MTVPTTLRIRRPDDWHLHLRDGELMAAVLPYTSAVYGRAIVMPNLAPPVTTVAAAAAYRRRILDALPAGHDFTPLMTCDLSESVTADELERGYREGVFTAAKLYPANATTNSAHGIRDVTAIYPLCEVMQRIGMPLLIHGEVTRAEVDIFDREKVFIDTVMAPLRRAFPELKIVFEHITTGDAAQYVQAGDDCLAATIPRSTWPTIATTCWSAAFARTCTACRSSSAAAISRHCARRSPAVIHASSWAPTRRRIWPTPRRPPAAAPGCSTRRPRSRSMPRYSRRRARSTTSRRSVPRTVRASMAWHSTRATSS